MKRKLSLLLVVMMMLSLIPANMAFAASDAVSSTVVTSSDAIIDFQISIEPKVLGFTTGKTFELSLGDKAEWVEDFTTSGAIQASRDSKRAEFTVATTGVITLRSKVELKGAANGEQKVTIEDINGSGVSRQVLTYAVVSGTGDVITRTLETKKTVTRGTATGASFEIREASQTAIPTNAVVKLRLPKDVAWATGTTVRINGDLVSTTPTLSAFGARELIVNNLTTPAAWAANNRIDRIVVNPVFSTTRDSKLGEIAVEVMGDIDGEDVVIADYVDYGVVLKVDKVKEIIAGRTDTNKDYRVKITLETAGTSFNTNRPVDFVVENGYFNVITSTLKNVTTTNFTTNSDGDEFEMKATLPGEDIEFEAYVSADWDNTKEVNLTAKGGGVDEQTIKVADVLAPAKIEVKKVEDFRIGVQGQTGSEIVITETKAGSLKEGYYVIDFDKASFGVTFTRPVATVKEGNIEVGRNITSDGTKIWIEVESESTKNPSVMTLSGYNVSLDRTVPEGDLKAKFAWVKEPSAGWGTGSARTSARDARVNDVREHSKITNFVIGRVITNAPDAMRQTTVFTLDSATYTVGGVEMTLDAAPYISNNRTMLPIGTVARLAGASVNYSAETRTAVFTKDNLVVSMNLDTNILLVNGSPVPMDAKPEIVQSRAFVPVVFVAQAFGIQNGTDIVYDAATRTVTLFPKAQ